MFYTPDNRDFELLPHDPFKAIVAPRPIGWISSLSEDGVPNLAPYSFFNAIGSNPPLLMFSSEGHKDSSLNSSATGEFVFNYVGEEVEADMNASSIPAPAGVSEFDHCGIEQAPSNLVAPPRVAKAAASLECKVTQLIEPTDIGGRKTGVVLVLGQVVGVHINENYIRNGRFDVNLAKPVSRLGYLDFGHTREIHELLRPKWNG